MPAKTRDIKDMTAGQMMKRHTFLRQRVADDMAEMDLLKEHVMADFNRPVIKAKE